MGRGPAAASRTPRIIVPKTLPRMRICAPVHTRPGETPVKRILGIVLTLLCLGVRPADAAAPPAGFELKDGDRVVFVCDALIERDATHGYLETVLTARYPRRNVFFRNLGW